MSQKKYLRHEALHTVDLLSEVVHTRLIEHPYYVSKINPLFNKKVTEAFNLLNEAYQVVGDKANEKKRLKILNFRGLNGQTD